MEMLDIIAGLAWDPEIRGFLAVLTGVVVLPGSVWLLVSTNSGPRLGTLISLAGFFGWMTIMAAIWWIYGIGYAGDAPTWEEVEIVEGTSEEGHLTFAALDDANLLRSEDLPSAHEIVVDAADELVDRFGEDVLTTMNTGGLRAEDQQHIAEVRTAWQEYGIVTVDSLTPDQTEGLSGDERAALADEEQAKNEATTLSELAAVAPGLIDQDSSTLGGWTLLSTGEAGEAQASAIAMLLESGEFDFENQGQFKVLDAFTIGGKRGLPDDPNRWDLPGQAPKRPVVDSEEPVISIVMIRNLGNLRLVPALVAIGSLLIFLALCYMMHERDKLVMARRAAFEAG